MRGHLAAEFTALRSCRHLHFPAFLGRAKVGEFHSLQLGLGGFAQVAPELTCVPVPALVFLGAIDPPRLVIHCIGVGPGGGTPMTPIRGVH